MKASVKRRDGGVSPVIATILMVAITVVLAASLYLMIPDVQDRNTMIQPIQFQSEKVGDHNWTLIISSNDLNPLEMKYAIEDVNGTYPVSGAEFPITPGVEDTRGITWHDGNNDMKVNTGDSITINNSTIGSGYIFRITAGANGYVKLP